MGYDFFQNFTSVHLISTGNLVSGNQEFCLVPSKTMVEQVKNKKSHSWHGLRIKTSGDMLGLRLLNKKHIYLTKCHFSFKIHKQFF